MGSIVSSGWIETSRKRRNFHENPETNFPGIVEVLFGTMGLIKRAFTPCSCCAFKSLKFK